MLWFRECDSVISTSDFRLNRISMIRTRALVALAVNITSLLTGYVFFFNAAKTIRETEFTKIADTIELELRQPIY